MDGKGWLILIMSLLVTIDYFQFPSKLITANFVHHLSTIGFLKKQIAPVHLIYNAQNICIQKVDYDGVTSFLVQKLALILMYLLVGCIFFWGIHHHLKNPILSGILTECSLTGYSLLVSCIHHLPDLPIEDILLKSYAVLAAIIFCWMSLIRRAHGAVNEDFDE